MHERIELTFLNEEIEFHVQTLRLNVKANIQYFMK